MLISTFDLEPMIFDLENKNSKFRRMRYLRIVPKNISMRFRPSPIKTVGQVPKSTKKMHKNDQFITLTVEWLLRRPQDVCLAAIFLKMHIQERFDDDWTSEKL